MGYNTQFSGDFFDLHKPLSSEHKAYLEKFSNSRRVKRDIKLLDRNPTLEAVGLPLGEEGAYFVDTPKPYAEEIRDPSVVAYNKPPKGQPSLWCGWTPSSDGKKIVWDESEKFEAYVEWIEYIIEHFLKPWGYVLNGSCKWEGEERDDYGIILLESNTVKVLYRCKIIQE